MQASNSLALREGSAATLDLIYPWLVRDFPPAELKSRAQFERLLNGGHYTLYLADHQERGIVGYALMFRPLSPQIGWLDYFAIVPEHRGAGFGSVFINALCQRLGAGVLGLMMEVEPPTSDDPTVQRNQRRRIAFYQRIGARQLDVAYHFPTQAGPEPMFLFFRPIAKVDALSKSQLQELIRAVYAHIHDDVRDREARLETFIDAIGDATLR